MMQDRHLIFDGIVRRGLSRLAEDKGAWATLREIIISAVPLFVLAVAGFAWSLNNSVRDLSGEVRTRFEIMQGSINTNAEIQRGVYTGVDVHLHAIDQRLDRIETSQREWRASGGDTLQPRLQSLESGVIELTKKIDGLPLMQERESGIKLKADATEVGDTVRDSRINSMENRLSIIESKLGIRPTEGR